MVSLFRKFRLDLIQQSRLGKYLAYAMGEIILVVIGILIALQINNWNNHRINQENAQRIYRQIHEQINEDEKSLEEAKGINNYFSRTYQFASQIIQAKQLNRVDTLAYLSMGLSQYSDFRRNSNMYQTLVNSGDIKLLRNTSVTDGLQHLEMTYNHINQLESIHWEVIINELSPVMRGVINYATLQVVDNEKLFSVEMQNIIIESIFLTAAKDSVYSNAILEIQSLRKLLDNEIR